MIPLIQDLSLIFVFFVFPKSIWNELLQLGGKTSKDHFQKYQIIFAIPFNNNKKGFFLQRYFRNENFRLPLWFQLKKSYVFIQFFFLPLKIKLQSFIVTNAYLQWKVFLSTQRIPFSLAANEAADIWAKDKPAKNKRAIFIHSLSLLR